MESRIESALWDIASMIDQIEGFLPEQRDFFEFKKDLKTQKAVERNLTIIGEAVNRILKIQPEFPLQNARKIVDMRNRVIHAYDNISQDIIWGIVVKNLPDLKEEVKRILEVH